MKRLFRRWHTEQRNMKHALRDTYIHRILGERIFHRYIWSFDLKSLAGGLSLGLFVAFTPTIPFQMLLCAAGAIFLRVNLPVSLIACWITNPFTALPIYLTARRFGQYMLQHSQAMEFVLNFFGIESRTGRIVEQGLYLWAGSLMFSAASALIGNIAVRSVWALSKRLKGMALGDKETTTDDNRPIEVTKIDRS